MDIVPVFTNMFAQLWHLFLSIAVLAILGVVVKSPWFKGKTGELWVRLLLKLFLPKDQYHVVNNVTLPTEDGTTQIDHIVVSPFGVFVVETKNLRGWIYGSTTQGQWTQKIFKHTNKFQNPIHQNYKHLKVLEQGLGIPAEKLFSVVVFIGDSEFKTPMPDYVTYARGCVRYIRSKTTGVLSEAEIQKVLTDIATGSLERSFKTDRAHVAHVKEIVQSKRAEPQCPKCGSAMLLRVARKGANPGREFWGCSAFPRCRAMVKVG